MPSPAASISSSISWRVYDEEHHLSQVLTEAARACVSARAANPSEYLYAYFAQATRGDAVEGLACAPVFSPTTVSEPRSIYNASPLASVLMEEPLSKRGALTADAGQGLRVALRLFTRTEAVVTVMRSTIVALPEADRRPSLADGTAEVDLVSDSAWPALDGAAVTEALLPFLVSDVVPLLHKVGVYDQHPWDTVLATQRMAFVASGPPQPDGPGSRGGALTAALPSVSSGRPSRTSSAATGNTGGTAGGGALSEDAENANGIVSVPCQVPVPAAMQMAFSLSACLAAARSVDRPLFRHIQTVAQKALGAAHGEGEAGSLTTPTTEIDTGVVSLPQLLIPFFGAESDVPSPPAGCVTFHTLYILPRAGADGTLSPSLCQRLVRAYQVLRERFHQAPVRPDGAVVLDCFENLVDAVQTASEVLQAVNVVVGEEAVFGIRLCSPVATLGAAAMAVMAGSSTSVPQSQVPGSAGSGQGKKASATTGAGNKKGSGGGGNKQATANPSEFTYTSFSGDPDVTGVQLAEYLKQQVAECEGRLVFLQDTHHHADSVGLARLQRGLRLLGGCATCSSTDTPSPQEHGESVTRVATDAVEVRFLQVGTVTALATRCAQLSKAGRDVVLSADAQEVDPLRAVVDTAIGLGAAYCNTGALTLPAACSALSHLCDVQQALLTKRLLSPQAPLAGMHAPPAATTEDDAAQEEEPVPDIKRKADKKRKKGK